MYPKLIVSALLGLGLLVLTASGQQPPPQIPKAREAAPSAPIQPKKGGGGEGGAKADPSDALVHAALMHDPDVKMAQAKIQLAEAELSKAKQAVVLKVMTLNATVKELKGHVASVTQSAQLIENGFQKGTVPLSEVLESRMKLEQAQNALAKAEMELKLLTGGMIEMGAKGGDVHLGIESLDAARERANALAAINWLAATMKEKPAAKGPIADRIRAALDKPVKLAAKGEEVTFEKAIEIFKVAGLDVAIRKTYPVRPITSEGEELPVGAWFQMFADSDRQRTSPPGPGPQFFVREYGLLVTSKELAPPDALSLMEFWKQPLKDLDVKPADPNIPKK